MGIFTFRILGFFAALSVVFAASVQAQNKVLEQLEAGGVVSDKVGAAILVQILIKKDAETVLKALTEDIKKLPASVPQISLARPYTIEKRNLVYLKLRGAGDGVGVLMEMKEGPSDGFVNARELIKSAGPGVFRDAAKSELEDLPNLNWQTDLSKGDPKSGIKREIGRDTVVLLEGPLNEIPQAPSLRLSVQFSVAPYRVELPAPAGAKASDPLKYALFQVKVAFGSQAVIGSELGDYRGFGDRQIEMAKSVGETVVRSIKARLEGK